MAITLPLNFPLPGESAVASYDYEDIVDGSGIVLLQAIGFTDSTGETYGLSKNSLYGDPTETGSDPATEANFTIEKTLTFSSAIFNTPRTIKGIAYIDGTMGLVESGATDGFNAKITFTFYHYDGSTQTSIGSVTTETVESTHSSTKLQSFCLKTTLTQKLFQIGEVLQIKVDVYLQKTGGTSNNQLFLAFDPMGNDTTHISSTNNQTTLRFLVPFKINL